MNTFSFVGKIVPIKDTEKFKGYEEKTFPSGWMTQSLRWNVVAGDDRHLVMINAGRWKDDDKNSVIYTMSRATEGKKSEKIQIPWSKRNDHTTIDSVAGNHVFTVDTDTYANREALKKSGDETAYAESVKKRKHFLANTDFCEWTKKIVYSEKVKDMVFRFNGNIVYRYNPNDGKYYSSYEVNKIYRVDENTEPSSNLNIEFFYADGFMDKEYIEESGKAVMRGFTPFYDTTTKKSWFTPIELVFRGDANKADVTEECMASFDDNNEICRAVLSCKAIDGAQRVDIKVTDLDERTQKAIAAGIMDEKTAIRNAGGQAYGDRIQEIRFDGIVKMGEPTAYTLDDCIQKPHKEEEQVDIFSDDDI